MVACNGELGMKVYIYLVVRHGGRVEDSVCLGTREQKKEHVL